MARDEEYGSASAEVWGLEAKGWRELSGEEQFLEHMCLEVGAHCTLQSTLQSTLQIGQGVCSRTLKKGYEKMSTVSNLFEWCKEQSKDSEGTPSHVHWDTYTHCRVVGAQQQIPRQWPKISDFGPEGSGDL